MTLDSLTHGAPWHIDEFLDSSTRQLVTILCLPLIDGVFGTMLVSGSIRSVTDVVAVALTIFAGAGALAVIFSSTEDASEARITVLKATPLLVLGALLVSLVAPVYEQVVSIGMMQQVAGLALMIIAGKMLDLSYVRSVSVPAIVGTGLILSAQNPGSISLTYSYVVPGVSTALVASVALYLATYIDRDYIQVAEFRKGAAFVLLVIALPMFGIGTPPNAAIITLSASLIYSIDVGLFAPRILKRSAHPSP